MHLLDCALSQQQYQYKRYPRSSLPFRHLQTVCSVLKHRSPASRAIRPIRVVRNPTFTPHTGSERERRDPFSSLTFASLTSTHMPQPMPSAFSFLLGRSSSSSLASRTSAAQHSCTQSILYPYLPFST
ncbi:unnamed protein product [Mortierella alpina]